MQNKETTAVQNPAMIAVGSRPDVLVWRQQAGLFQTLNEPRRVVRVGVPGMSDAMMVVAVTITPDMVGRTVGVAVAPEFKTRTGRQSQSQRGFEEAFTQRGGVYRLVRDRDDMLALVDDVQAGRAFKAGSAS